jgi:hypothetical protein
LGLDEVAGLLEETLAEEKEADEKLTQVGGDVLTELESAGEQEEQEEEETGTRRKGVAAKSKANGRTKRRAS